MCKCKSLFESCYWHCFEKHFCWDEEIALYEEPKEELIETRKEQNNNAFDNFAFYDNVAFIANRAIFTIEPLNPPTKTITDQPKKKLRWFEEEENQNDVLEFRNVHQKKMSIVHEESDTDTSSVDTVDLGEDQKKDAKDETPIKNKVTEEVVKMRKKSLQQRRLSKALSLQLERKELPLIRQSSVPKFYIDTPEVNQIDSCVARTPSIALNTPILPQTHEFNYDLSSVVQIHKERQSSIKNAKAEVKRATSLKEKIKRQSSLISLSSLSTNHM